MNHHTYSPPPPSNSFIPPRHTILAPLPCFPGFYSVDFHGELIQVTVAKKAAHVHQWIWDSPSSPPLSSPQPYRWHRHRVLPNLAPGDDHPIAILQLCVGHHCLIVQLLHADTIPPSLCAFFANPRHVFCGIGVQEDMMKLYDHHGLTVVNTADLNELATLASGADGREYNHLGLKKAGRILGKAMMKLLRVTLSKWDSHDLDFEQVEYAAIDAFVSFQIAHALCSCIVN
ncbi:UNVERIFIED_CONTAM: hypothetical protein Slati_3692000 [Sesamum latifolium]|uniref:3'-5' exonuclease domain-containing protein n=1 Tax=Sesamum latifolium TaxID=2727402 RepID=A0AAW2U2M2_9LAMI